jgi:hypothetical protein
VKKSIMRDDHGLSRIGQMIIMSHIVDNVVFLFTHPYHKCERIPSQSLIGEWFSIY